MANYKFLTYLFLGALLAWFLGYKFEVYFIIIGILTIIYKSFKALLANNETSVRHNYPTEGFGNISFNDSFS